MSLDTSKFRQGLKYLAVGGTTFLLDLGLLIFLHHFLKLNLALATTISFWVALLYNFALTRLWTFNKTTTTNLHKHFALYMLLIGVNYLFTVLFVTLAAQIISYIIAKTIATAFQTMWNYPVYKYFIFKR